MARRKRRSNSAPAAASSSPPPGRPLESLQHGDRLAVRDADHGYWLATFAEWACSDHQYARVRYFKIGMPPVIL